MATKNKVRIRRGGYIFTETRAKKSFDCNVCPKPIIEGVCYLTVEKGGGGVSWAVRPDRIHYNEEHIQTYIDKYGF